MARLTDEHQDPKRKRRSVGRIKDDSIVGAVKHIMTFVQTVSWGVKRLSQNGSNVLKDFPRLTRTLPIETMYLDYVKKEEQFKLTTLDNGTRPPSERVKRTTYFSICSTLTSRAEKSISCIDYVQDILINTRVTGLIRVIEQLVAPTQQQKMKGYLRVIQHFLKYQYGQHLKPTCQVSAPKANHDPLSIHY